MQFVTNGNQVFCIRDSALTEEVELHAAAVSSFDAHLAAIPIHVEAALSGHEQAELQRWLDQQQKTQQRKNVPGPAASV